MRPLIRRALPRNTSSRIKVLRQPHPELGTPCWVWTGRLNRNGYGRAWFGGHEPVVHRVTWTVLKGPVPEGLILDHKCRRRSCCNPEHVEPVTHATNTRRGNAVLFRPTPRGA